MCRVDEAALTAEQIRRARHAYFAAVSYLDERVGEVLGALQRSGMADRTTVLFCADHGEMLGERGLWYKMSFFEQSARVPLIVRVPGAGPRRVAEPVSLLDVTPTLLELAGLPPRRCRRRGAGPAAGRGQPRRRGHRRRARAGSAGRLRVPRRGGHGTVGDGP